MYWYISFLRPPPVSAEARGSIIITPQVANDLRTELRYEPTKIHYFWQRTEPTISPPLSSEYLTTFIPPESTYRPLSLSLPGQAGIGERWRLCLFDPTIQAGKQDILTLTSDTAPGPLSVYSEGIEIVRPNIPAGGGVTRGVTSQKGSGKNKGKGKADERDLKRVGKGKEKDEGIKQSRIMREWDTPVGRLRIVEQTSFDLDKKIWDSGLGLSSWLYRYLQSESSLEDLHPLARRMLDQLKGRGKVHNILELGSGTGLVSIGLHSLLSGSDIKGSGKITATDLGTAIELMKENMSINAERSGSSQIEGQLQLSANVLDWDEPLPNWISGTEDEQGWPSLIIAADVTYNTASFPSLVRTLKSLLLPPDRSDRPRLLLAYKQRDPGERELWGLLEKEGMGLDLVDKIEGAVSGCGEVEIWVYRTPEVCT